MVAPIACGHHYPNQPSGKNPMRRDSIEKSTQDGKGGFWSFGQCYLTPADELLYRQYFLYNAHVTVVVCFG